MHVHGYFSFAAGSFECITPRGLGTVQGFASPIVGSSGKTCDVASGRPVETNSAVHWTTHRGNVHVAETVLSRRV